ncbi:hypothetical protein R5M92_08570 [Halomonas sp. Bachu 37]|uniref:hypothetical protein n=1 Tax=Halomonas kashgarensis TaxID=3084920 RepID=UPI003217767D
MLIESLPFKLWLLSRAERAGIHIQSMKRCRPVDARRHRGNPLELSYRYPGRNLLLEAPTEWGFGLFNVCNRRRFLNGVMQQAFDHPGQERDLLREALRDFYTDWQPANAAEFLNIPPAEAGELIALPPWQAPWPWDTRNFAEKKDKRERTELRENTRILGRRLGIDAGWKCCGPVSDDKLEIEVERLTHVLESVRRQGICRHDGNDGDIRADVLTRPDGCWRWLVHGGQHRYAVISALGNSRITIRAESFIRREDVSLWPPVIAGVFTPELALKIFDDHFTQHDSNTSLK